MSLQYPDMMVDIETTGTMPDRHAIIQIAAVKFNLAEQTISPQMFKASLDMPEKREWDPQTKLWWGKQKRSVFDAIVAECRPWQQVMEEFLEYAGPAGDYRFWSKPTHFDYVFISSYFKDADLPQMFSYRDANDMNSYIRGLYQGDPVPEIPYLEIDAHDALNDCIIQIDQLFKHTTNVKGIQIDA